MEYLTREIRRSLLTRSRALRLQVEALAGRTPKSREAILRACDLFFFFCEALDETLANEWERNPSDLSRLQICRLLLQHTGQATTFFERWLQTASDLEENASLHRAVELECQVLGVGDRHAILAPGDASNWETYPAELATELLKPVGPPLGPATPDDIRDTRYALLRVPRYEGGQALWRPVVLGHELAHLAIREHDTHARLGLDAHFDWDRAAHIALPASVHSASPALMLSQIARSWSEELMCDAHAVRRFGVAGVASLAEFLSVVSTPGMVSTSHPPPWLRIRLMVEWLGDEIPDGYREVVAPWVEQANLPSPGFDPWIQFLIETLTTISAELLQAVEPWCERYPLTERTELVAGISRAVRSGLPGLSMSDDALPADEDVINAGWVANSGEDSLDHLHLIEKNLQTLDFLRQWAAAGGAIHRDIGSEEDRTRRDSDSHPVGVLDRARILKRIEDETDPLVIDPLVQGAIQSAAVDLRLGHEFIVFQRTRTSSFDPLREGTDPREMQRRVSRNWGEPFVLHPNELVLASTLEYLVLPADLSGQVITRSSYGRLGLLTATAVQVHPGFHGCLTLELVNLGQMPIELTPGERIAQLVLFSTGETVPGRQKYWAPTGPQFSKVRDDEESQVLRRMRQAET